MISGGLSGYSRLIFTHGWHMDAYLELRLWKSSGLPRLLVVPSVRPQRVQTRAGAGAGALNVGSPSSGLGEAFEGLAEVDDLGGWFFAGVFGGWVELTLGHIGIGDDVRRQLGDVAGAGFKFFG